MRSFSRSTLSTLVTYTHRYKQTYMPSVIVPFSIGSKSWHEYPHRLLNPVCVRAWSCFLVSAMGFRYGLALVWREGCVQLQSAKTSAVHPH